MATPVGDQVLRRVAKRLRDQLRSGDLLARIGGEEVSRGPARQRPAVGARLRGTSADGHRRRTLRLRPRHPPPLEVTLSVGIALAAAGSGETRRTACWTAPMAALYGSKAEGRDQVNPVAALGSLTGHRTGQRSRRPSGPSARGPAVRPARRARRRSWFPHIEKRPVPMTLRASVAPRARASAPLGGGAVETARPEAPHGSCISPRTQRAAVGAATPRGRSAQRTASRSARSSASAKGPKAQRAQPRVVIAAARADGQQRATDQPEDQQVQRKRDRQRDLHRPPTARRDGGQQDQTSPASAQSIPRSRASCPPPARQQPTAARQTGCRWPPAPRSPAPARPAPRPSRPTGPASRPAPRQTRTSPPRVARAAAGTGLPAACTAAASASTRATRSSPGRAAPRGPRRKARQADRLSGSVARLSQRLPSVLQGPLPAPACPGRSGFPRPPRPHPVSPRSRGSTAPRYGAARPPAAAARAERARAASSAAIRSASSIRASAPRRAIGRGVGVLQRLGPAPAAQAVQAEVRHHPVKPCRGLRHANPAASRPPRATTGRSIRLLGRDVPRLGPSPSTRAACPSARGRKPARSTRPRAPGSPLANEEPSAPPSESAGHNSGGSPGHVVGYRSPPGGRKGRGDGGQGFLHRRGASQPRQRKPGPRRSPWIAAPRPPPPPPRRPALPLHTRAMAGGWGIELGLGHAAVAICVRHAGTSARGPPAAARRAIAS